MLIHCGSWHLTCRLMSRRVRAWTLVSVSFVLCIHRVVTTTGARLKKERKYLGQQKERSIAIDLTKLQARNEYLRDARISQAESLYLKEVAARKHQDQLQHEAAAAHTVTLASEEAAGDTGEVSTVATRRANSALRVGTVKRVPRHSSAQDASRTNSPSPTPSTGARPQSAMGNTVCCVCPHHANVTFE